MASKQPKIARSMTASQPDIAGGSCDPGAVVKRLRKQKKLLLVDLAKLSGVAASTISRIENGKVSPTYNLLNRIVEALGVRWADILGSATSSFAPGCRAVDRASMGIKQVTSRGVYEWLGTDLLTKDMEPTVIEVKAEDGGPPVIYSHAGQELIYVLQGTIAFHMQHYTPLELQIGDSVYFDANTPHGVCARGGPARILSIVSRPR